MDTTYTNQVNVKCRCGHQQIVMMEVASQDQRFIDGLLDSSQFCDKCEQMRRWVMDYMASVGQYRARLTDEHWKIVYLSAADGFGRIERAKAEEQGWDWSHVRDSSVEAFRNMAYTILGIVQARYSVTKGWED